MLVYQRVSQLVFVDLSDPDVDRMKAFVHQLQLRLKAKIASMP